MRETPVANSWRGSRLRRHRTLLAHSERFSSCRRFPSPSASQVFVVPDAKDDVKSVRPSAAVGLLFSYSTGHATGDPLTVKQCQAIEPKIGLFRRISRRSEVQAQLLRKSELCRTFGVDIGSCSGHKPVRSSSVRPLIVGEPSKLAHKVVKALLPTVSLYLQASVKPCCLYLPRSPFLPCAPRPLFRGPDLPHIIPCDRAATNHTASGSSDRTEALQAAQGQGSLHIALCPAACNRLQKQRQVSLAPGD